MFVADKNEGLVCILMATYNGEKYLVEQIESILNQSITNWILLIRDDGSYDNTKKILALYEAKDPRIYLIDDVLGNLGVTSNFNRLMEVAFSTSCRYFCFADQDDVWNKDKIKLMLEALIDIEKKQDGVSPILLYSDLEVVDSNLNQIHPSFMKFQGLKHPANQQLEQLMTQNVITGCASFFNKALLEKAIPIPKSVIVHDWWLGLCAAVYQKNYYLDLALVKYRQHSTNQIGAIGRMAMNNPFGKFLYIRLIKSCKNFINSVEQSRSLLAHMKKIGCNEELLEKLELFSIIGKYNRLKRVWLLRSNGIRRTTFLGTLILYLWYFLL